MPFSFLSSAGGGTPRPPKPVLEVRALPERAHLRIEFPRLLGYRYEMPTERLTARFDEGSVMALSTDEVPTQTELDPIVGERTIHNLDDLRDERLQTVIYMVAKRTLDNHFRDTVDPDWAAASPGTAEPSAGERPWLFPQLVAITRRWLAECVQPHLKDHAFPQLLLLAEYSHAAAERIHRAIVIGTEGEKRLMPVLRPYEALGSTDGVWFETTKPCYDAAKSHLDRIVLDSGWEAKLGEVLDGMTEVVSYVKNQGLNGMWSSSSGPGSCARRWPRHEP